MLKHAWDERALFFVLLFVVCGVEELGVEQTLTSHSLANSELGIIAGARMIQMIAYRIIYPLTPFLALHLGVSAQAVTLLVTVQVVASLLSPIGGVLSAVAGQRTTMCVGLLLFTLGTGLCAASGSFTAFLVGYALIGFAVTVYHPAAQSYLSARTSYARRGWALGMYEVSWAASALVGIAPLMYLVGRTQQPQLVFAILTVAALIGLAFVRFALPSANESGMRGERVSWNNLALPGVLALLAFFVLVLCGSDLIFVIQSIWLNHSFGADEAAVGSVAAMQGVAELLGSTGSAALVDRLGKKRSVFLGYGLMGVAALLLPLSSGQWLLFLPVFFLFDLGFEFGIVSSFPLASGVAPAARSTVLAFCAVAVGIGRTFGSLLAEPLWAQYGIGANALLGAAITAASLAICGLFVRENEQ